MLQHIITPSYGLAVRVASGPAFVTIDDPVDCYEASKEKTASGTFFIEEGSSHASLTHLNDDGVMFNRTRPQPYQNQ